MWRVFVWLVVVRSFVSSIGLSILRFVLCGLASNILALDMFLGPLRA